MIEQNYQFNPCAECLRRKSRAVTFLSEIYVFCLLCKIFEIRAITSARAPNKILYIECLFIFNSIICIVYLSFKPLSPHFFSHVRGEIFYSRSQSSLVSVMILKRRAIIFWNRQLPFTIGPR